MADITIPPEELDQKEKRQFWEDHVQAWEQIGLTQAEYCRQNSLRITDGGIGQKEFHILLTRMLNLFRCGFHQATFRERALLFAGHPYGEQKPVRHFTAWFKQPKQTTWSPTNICDTPLKNFLGPGRSGL